MKKNGFTLIELLICLVILSVILTQAIPSMNYYINNERIRRIADEVNGTLQQAKTESIRRNTSIAFTSNGTTWTLSAPATNTILVTRSALPSESKITLASTQNPITFLSTGNVNAATTINITSPNVSNCIAAGGNSRCLNITVSASGRIKLCDPSLNLTDANAC